ncbi:hypothetical protein PGB90_007717 [Kerria lacca]
MIKTLITFGIGIYIGVFVAQNYEIQKVDDPQKILERIKTYINENIGDKKK